MTLFSHRARLAGSLAAMLIASAAAAETSSWVFLPSNYSHDPYTGARVAQYERVAPVEPLDDPRLVTSRYHRTLTTLRGANGSVDTTYEVQSYGNDRGGLDAQWERFHDAWLQSTLTGSYFNSAQPAPYGQGYGYPGYGAGYGNPGGAPGGYYPPAHGAPVYGPPAYGPPAYGPPAYGPPGYGAPAYGPPAYGPGYPEPGPGGGRDGGRGEPRR